MIGGSFVRDVQEQSFAVEVEVRAAWPFNSFEAVAASPDVVRLPRDHFSFGLPLDGLEFVALALDPRQALHDGQANVVVVEALRGSNANAAHRRVHADVQVLDILVNNIDVDAADREVGATDTHGVPSPVQTARRGGRSQQAAPLQWPFSPSVP